MHKYIHNIYSTASSEFFRPCPQLHCTIDLSQSRSLEDSGFIKHTESFSPPKRLTVPRISLRLYTCFLQTCFNYQKLLNRKDIYLPQKPSWWTFNFEVKLHLQRSNEGEVIPKECGRLGRSQDTC